MNRAFEYRPYPSKTQKKRMESVLGTCRRFCNGLLAKRRDAWEQERRSVSKFEQLREVKTLKKTNPHATGVHSHVLQLVVVQLDLAFQAFYRRVNAGEKPGYPRFKSRDRFSSFGFKEYGNGFRLDGRRLRLSGIGRVAVRWHRPLPCAPKTVRIVRRADGWYAMFTREVNPAPLPSTGKDVGVDVGVAALILPPMARKFPTRSGIGQPRGSYVVNSAAERRFRTPSPRGARRRQTLDLLLAKAVVVLPQSCRLPRQSPAFADNLDSLSFSAPDSRPAASGYPWASLRGPHETRVDESCIHQYAAPYSLLWPD